MPNKLPLRLEIVLLLLAKCVLLFFIWKLCFSHPLDKNFIPSDVEHHVFSLSHST